jgi:hypothetical protein
MFAHTVDATDTRLHRHENELAIVEWFLESSFPALVKRMRACVSGDHLKGMTMCNAVQLSNNAPVGIHKDTDVAGVIFMFVTGEDFQSFPLGLPAFNTMLDVKCGDLLVLSSHEYHGTAIHHIHGADGYTRRSLIFFVKRNTS